MTEERERVKIVGLEWEVYRDASGSRPTDYIYWTENMPSGFCLHREYVGLWSHPGYYWLFYIGPHLISRHKTKQEAFKNAKRHWIEMVERELDK